MRKLFQIAAIVVLSAPVSALAAVAPAAPVEEREFPLAIVFALIAVFCGIGAALFASQSKKK
ncbi:MAG TPA: hypothetical protein VM915_02330 [Verrucomicrobiae bacterium]|nr:hypothetical protein [Verrucomicrobiae bacterium]